QENAKKNADYFSPSLLASLRVPSGQYWRLIPFGYGVIGMAHAPLIDFHSHYYDPSWMPAATPRGFSAAFARAQALLTDIDAQLAAMDAAGVDMKVLSAPLSTLVGPGEEPPVSLTT